MPLRDRRLWLIGGVIIILFYSGVLSTAILYPFIVDPPLEDRKFYDAYSIRIAALTLLGTLSAGIGFFFSRKSPAELFRWLRVAIEIWLTKRSEDRNKRIRILFLSANPSQTSRLDLEEEMRAIEMELGATKHRDSISMTACHAIRPDDLLRHLRDYSPTVVHFSGHGSKKGIILRNDSDGFQLSQLMRCAACLPSGVSIWLC